MTDPITAPEHYEGTIECIDSIRAALGDAAFIDYCRANALKYIWRAGRKGPALEDLQKARVYLLFAENAILEDDTKAHLDAEVEAVADCDECRAQAEALIASLEDHLEDHRASSAKIIANMQAKIDRQRSQLRSRGAFQSLIPDIQAWQRKTFPDATTTDYLAKLKEEAMELEAAMEGFGNPGEELADMAICLIGLSGALKIPLAEWVNGKFEKNKTRSWEQDCHGYYHHKK